ncbi:hypothetical protein FQN57_000753 [Myotisia sp. PD_48]|nr:hypothetical protein FQN57_000753 [Myotisia sp. PD_48]
MAVRIQLDKPLALFTNLDYISGKVILTLPVDTGISSIVVKLEGESRTRLAANKYPNSERDKKRTEVETHKFPFNNDCLNNHLANLNMGGLRLEVARDANTHVRRTLPPSITGFPGEAEIRYYVKATVVRPQFYKENYRGFTDFKFLPIEPPRRPQVDKETYARRKHQFTRELKPPPKKGFFQKSSPQIPNSHEVLPRYCVDARLPTPAILTCHEPVPLRVILKKLSPGRGAIFLQVLQIELIGYTHVRAHDLKRSESGSWVLVSRSNIGRQLCNGNEPVGHEYILDAGMWNRTPIPPSVAPSFDTCNLSRTYELEIRIGLTHESPGSVKPELVVIPLRMPVQVYSGIAPPKALLEAMGIIKPRPSEMPVAPPQPPRPLEPPVTPQSQGEMYEEAPPSYEDAMAEALAPVDGPRREYTPLGASRTSSWTGTDAKTSVGNFDQKGDERLFPNSALESEPLSISTTPFAAAVSSPNSQDSPEKQDRFPEFSGPRQQQQVPEPQDREAEQQQQDQPRRVTPQLGIPNRKPVPEQGKLDS